MSVDALTGMPVIESPYVDPGKLFIADRTIIAHRFDVIWLMHREWTPVQRVMWLVDRNIASALKRIGI